MLIDMFDKLDMFDTFMLIDFDFEILEPRVFLE